MTVFTINIPMHEWRKLVAVAPSVAIKDVVLTGTSASVNRELVENENASCEVDLHPSFDDFNLINDRVLVADVGLKVTLLLAERDDDDSSGRSLAEIEVKLSVGYDLPPPPIPKDVEESFEAFAKYNALYNCWPFFREHVSYLSHALRLPIMLPVLRLNQVEDDPRTIEATVESTSTKPHPKKQRRTGRKQATGDKQKKATASKRGKSKKTTKKPGKRKKATKK